MSKGIRFWLYIAIMEWFIIDIFCLAEAAVDILLIAVFSAMEQDACAFAQSGCGGDAVMDFCQAHEKNSFRLIRYLFARIRKRMGFYTRIGEICFVYFSFQREKVSVYL